MDPESLTNLDWTNIKVIVQTLWFVLVSVVVFGGAFLLAQVFLPAMAGPKIQPGQLKNIRLFLYSVSGASFIVAVFLVVRTFGRLNSILSFYARFWM